MTPIGMKSPRRPPRERPSEELLASKYTTPCFFAGLRCPTCGNPRPLVLQDAASELYLKQGLTRCPDPFHDSPACEGPMDLMHWIPARRLRAAHAPVWDPRIVAVSCRRHHHLLDNYFLRIPRDQLPPAVEEYAEEMGLLWSLDRDYPERH